MFKVKYKIYDRPMDLSLGPVQKETVEFQLVDKDGGEAKFPKTFYHSYGKQNPREGTKVFQDGAWTLLLLYLAGIEVFKSEDSQYDCELLKIYEAGHKKVIEESQKSELFQEGEL